MGDFIQELWKFMKERKKFWLLPIIVMLVVLSGLIFLTSGSVVAPFIYTLF
jgi:competence protein ComGC